MNNTITKTISAGRTYKKEAGELVKDDNGKLVLLKEWDEHEVELSTTTGTLNEKQVANIAYRLAKLELQYGVSTLVRNSNLKLEAGHKAAGLEYLGDGKFRLDPDFDPTAATAGGKKAAKIAEAIDAAIRNLETAGVTVTEELRKSVTDSIRSAMK